MDQEERKILFTLLESLLDDVIIDFGGDYHERFNTDENINNIITEIEKEFILVKKT